MNKLWTISLYYILISCLADSSGEQEAGSLTGKEEHRVKRSTGCPHQKYDHISGHTACLASSANLIRNGVTTQDIEDILNVHNQYRSQVSPAAKDMLKMSWEEEVAMIAQKWADNCQFVHDDVYKRFIPGKYTLGQNLGSGYESFNATIKAWYDEVNSFTYGGSNTLSNVGHYTQVVWAKSYKIGCGFAECSNLGGTTLFVCNYAPGGNYGDISIPYDSGSSCASCSGHCNNNLCDCGSTECYNRGSVNLDTCLCDCNEYYSGEKCYLNCSGTTDQNICQVYPESHCETYSNIPFDCPSKCGICPYGALYEDIVSNNSTTNGNEISTISISTITIVIQSSTNTMEADSSSTTSTITNDTNVKNNANKKFSDFVLFKNITAASVFMMVLIIVIT